jgi:ubiquinone/menaquinone biosynthesis C-methylase UbiE
MNGFLNPNEVLKQLKLKEDMTAADFGSGSGGWIIPLAKKLEEGKIYAIDILEEPLSALRAKTKLEKILNVETIQSNVEAKNGSTLLDSSCDLVLMTNLLFECEDKKLVLEEGKRVLKKGGKILVVDWKKDNPLTPKIEKISFDEVKKITEDLGLKLEKEFPAGAYHYGIILVK